MNIILKRTSLSSSVICLNLIIDSLFIIPIGSRIIT